MRYSESLRTCALIAVLFGVTPIVSPFRALHLRTAAPAERAASARAADPAASAPPVAGTGAVPVPAGSAETPPPAPPPSVLERNQLVVFYGSPISAGLGILGVFPPEEAATRVRDEASIYDGLNGDRGAKPAIDLIFEGATAEPTPDGLFLSYVGDEAVQTYLRLADQYDLQLILDLQIGRSTAMAELHKLDPYLANPRVHVAVDPEYAVGADGWPILTPGHITGDEINAMQDYLASVVQKHHLPPKMLVIHQWNDDTVLGGDVVQPNPAVSLVMNMDAFGDGTDKQAKYEAYASLPWAEHRSFNIFLHYDDPVFSEAQALALQPSPDVIFYQ